MKSRMIKKVVLMGMAVIVASTIMMGNGKSNVKAEDGVPEVTFVGVDHSPLIEGDTETFYLTAKNAEFVQYRVFLYMEDGTSEELTKMSDGRNGYINPVSANIPYKFDAPKTFHLGHHKLVVYVRAAGSTADYDNTYTAYINCVNKDDNNRVYANDSLKIDKDVYTLGETVNINGINNIGGIEGPYKYRLHLYDATRDTWVKNVTQYEDAINWTPTEPGVYVLDVHANTENSTTWPTYLNNQNNDNVYGTYEAWKLKTIVVNPATENIFQKSNIKEISNYGDGFIVNGDEVLLNDLSELKQGITPHLSTKDMSEELNTTVYNLVKTMIKDGTYTSLNYSSKAKNSNSRDDINIIHRNIITYHLYAPNSKETPYFTVKSGILNDENKADLLEYNKVLFNDNAKEVTDFIIDYYKENRNKKIDYSKPREFTTKVFGNYTIKAAAAGYDYCDYYFKKIK